MLTACCARVKILQMSRYPSAHGHTPSYRSVGSMPVYPSALGPRDLEFEVSQYIEADSSDKEQDGSGKDAGCKLLRSG